MELGGFERSRSPRFVGGGRGVEAWRGGGRAEERPEDGDECRQAYHAEERSLEQVAGAAVSELVAEHEAELGRRGWKDQRAVEYESARLAEAGAVGVWLARARPRIGAGHRPNG